MSTLNGTHSAPAESAGSGRVEHMAVDAERQVLGAAMIDDQACAKMIDLLEGEADVFVESRHRDIYEAIVRLFSEGASVDLSTVAQETDASAAYLAECTDTVATVATQEKLCRVLIEHWMAREADTMLGRARHYLNSDPTADIFEVLEGLQRRVQDLQLGQGGDTHIQHAASEAIRRAEEWREGIQRDVLPTGLYGLDGMIGGFPVGELTTVAAQTGAGKTSLIIQVLRTLATIGQDGGPHDGAALFFSAEMAGSQIAQRAASQMARIDLRSLRSGEADAADYDDFTEAAGRLSRLDWHVDDRPQPTFAHIAARCQQVQATDGLSFVAVDYDEKIDSQGQTEEQRVASIARGLKDLAKRFEVPVVALSQYSRKASENTGIPSDHWLRYSGKKEQESALILHWYWPGYFIDKGMRPEKVQNYDPGLADGKHGRGWMVCTKNRFGATGKTQLYFQPEYTRFIDPRDPEADTHGILPGEDVDQEPDLPTTEESPF